MFSIDKISEEVKDKGKLISAPKNLLVVRDNPAGDGSPYVEIGEDEYFYVSSERGYEIFRKRASNIDELLYFIFKDITWSMANEYELSNRIENKDSRRLIFSKKLDLLKRINPEWERRERVEIDKILLSSPYDDLAASRADYSRKLREQGLKESEIYELSNRKYPPPK